MSHYHVYSSQTQSPNHFNGYGVRDHQTSPPPSGHQHHRRQQTRRQNQTAYPCRQGVHQGHHCHPAIPYITKINRHQTHLFCDDVAEQFSCEAQYLWHMEPLVSSSSGISWMPSYTAVPLLAHTVKLTTSPHLQTPWLGIPILPFASDQLAVSKVPTDFFASKLVVN